MIISDGVGNYLRVNQAFCDPVGYSTGELREMTVRDLTHPDDRERAAARQAGLLDLVREIALAPNRANDFAEVVELSLHRVCEFLEWPVGHAYDIPAGDEDIMQSMAA